MLRSISRLICVGFVAGYCLSQAAGAQNATPQPNGVPGNSNANTAPVAPTRGQLAYTQNCAFCHGPDAHGGAEGGVDLTRSAIVTGDPTEAPLIAFLKVG